MQQRYFGSKVLVVKAHKNSQDQSLIGKTSTCIFEQFSNCLDDNFEKKKTGSRTLKKNKAGISIHNNMNPLL